jgi:AraC family transcriptional regulator
MDRVLYESDVLAFAEFHCPAGAPRWLELNTIESGPYVVFPGTTVVIRHVGGTAILANPNHVMFYNPGQRYQRSLRDPSGDRCFYIDLGPRLLAELTGGRDHLPFTHGPSFAGAYLAQRLVFSHLRSRRPDPLFVEETLAFAAGRVIADAFAVHRVRRRSRATTFAAHRELVESAKELLSTRLTERVPLRFFAQTLHTSEFHLARVFRSTTGFSLHQYRNQLRLRYALERLAAQDVPLHVLAHELGFASHSHFTDAFRNVFGVPPSALRCGLSPSDLRGLRRIVEASLLGEGPGPAEGGPGSMQLPR